MVCAELVICMSKMKLVVELSITKVLPNVPSTPSGMLLQIGLLVGSQG
jgi:hypothetical protein